MISRNLRCSCCFVKRIPRRIWIFRRHVRGKLLIQSHSSIVSRDSLPCASPTDPFFRAKGKNGRIGAGWLNRDIAWPPTRRCFYQRPSYYDATIPAVKANGTGHLRPRFSDALPRPYLSRSAKRCWPTVSRGPTVYPFYTGYNIPSGDIPLRLNVRFPFLFFTFTLRTFLGRQISRW